MTTALNGRAILYSTAIALFVIGATLQLLYAAAPTMVNYQGRLTGSSGDPVPDASYSVTFAIYDAPAGGTIIWSETQSVTTSSGLFTVLLGSVNPITSAVFSDAERYLSVQIGANPEQLPRQRFVTSAYAFSAEEAESAPWSGIQGIPAGFADGVDDAGGGDAYLSADQAFTGNNRFDGVVEVGDSIMRAGNNGILLGRDQLPLTGSVLEVRRNFNTSSPRYGAFMDVATDGSGNLRCLRARSLNNGPETESNDPVVGVEGAGFSDSGTRTGIYGYASTLTPSITSGDGFGVHGEAWYGGAAYGVRGVAQFAEYGYGLHGVARHSDLHGYGAVLTADSNDANGYGSYSEARGNGNAGFGVYAYAIDNDGTSYGIYARASNGGGTGYGVYGYATGNTGTNWAGYFNGDVNVTGTIVSPVKLTKLDHPLDPENMYLVHSAVESSEMVNSYSGNVVLDGSGKATVTFPAWFEEVNADYRYQLTCVGGYAPVFVEQEISNGNFTIAGGAPGLKISWQVTALRDDAYARTYPVSAEMTKGADEQGKYLHPETYGLSEERGVDYEHTVAADAPVGQ